MNETMIQFFHWYSEGDGKLWKEAQNQADYLSELGITSVWFPPAYKGTNGGYSIGYDAYDLFDLGEFDQKGSIPTKYGTKDDYTHAIKALKDKNIQVIVDIVLGHKAGGDELETLKP
ncbi:alpha-amylase family glycosyl hydrolase [Chryseobacterium arachidis]|uniref:alpha-amylase family glycosyl hydrolase n=1 Tax=Chryseobacterium arachidis TaxID=1416778 RepID=UPI003613FB49